MNMLAILTHYKKLKADKARIDDELKAIQSDVVDYMVANGYDGKMECGQYTAVVTECTKKSIDEKAFREKFPELAEEFTRTTEYTRFTVK